MTVYCVNTMDGFYYVPTKEQAVKEARDARANGDPETSVQRVTVTSRLGKRRLYCALLNGEKWAAGQEDVPL